jgi:MFS family permease
MKPATTSRNEADERAPLLSNDQTAQSQNLTTVELLALCWARCGQNWIYYAVFPFLPDLLRRIGFAEAQLGYYAGMVESSYSLAQFIAFLGWTRWADSYGRKQVLCVCLCGMGTASLAFGFSTKVWQMVLCRMIGGFFSASAL